MNRYVKQTLYAAASVGLLTGCGELVESAKQEIQDVSGLPVENDPNDTLAPLNTVGRPLPVVTLPPVELVSDIATTTPETTVTPTTTELPLDGFSFSFSGETYDCSLNTYTKVLPGDVPSTLIADRNGIDRSLGFGFALYRFVEAEFSENFPELLGRGGFNPGAEIAFPLCD